MSCIPRTSVPTIAISVPDDTSLPSSCSSVVTVMVLSYLAALNANGGGDASGGGSGGSGDGGSKGDGGGNGLHGGDEGTGTGSGGDRDSHPGTEGKSEHS